MKIATWDPEKDEDYVLDDFASKETFSSLTRNLYAVEVSEVIDDDPRYCRFVNELLSSTPILTLVVVPWLNKERFEAVFNNFIELDYASSNYSGVLKKNDGVVASQLLSARSELGGGDSGEWMFIGSHKTLPLSHSEIENGFSSILKHDFDFIIYMAEMQQVFAFFRRNEDLVSSIELLKVDT